MITIKNNTEDWNKLFHGKEKELFQEQPIPIDHIYLAGDATALLDESRKRILIIGTRDLKLTNYDYINQIVRQLSLSEAKPVIISGLALGTDTLVHSYALEYGLPTISVMATGLDQIYPFQNKKLAKQIKETPGCALLTQYDEKTAPTAFNFIQRTMTMTLMSDIAIIPFCKKKGATKLAARWMNSLDRPVYALPGRMDDINSEGCNELISEGIAKLLTKNELDTL